MNEKDFNGSVSAVVPAKQMDKLYALLENEEKPHSVYVRRCLRGTKQIIICCNAEDVAYFNTIVTNENKAKI